MATQGGTELFTANVLQFPEHFDQGFWGGKLALYSFGVGELLGGKVTILHQELCQHVARTAGGPWAETCAPCRGTRLSWYVWGRNGGCHGFGIRYAVFYGCHVIVVALADNTDPGL
jgi:hypothetical protein